MPKFSQEQKNEIITLKLNGTTAKEIMEKFNVSRAYIYKMMKENDIDYKSEVNTEIDITEYKDMGSEDIFDELNDIEIDKNEVEIDKKEVEIDINEQIVEPQPMQKPFLSTLNLDSAQRVNYIPPEKIKALNMFAEEKPIRQPEYNRQPENNSRQQIKINSDPTLSEDYPEMQNTMNVIKRYIDTYYDSGKLDDIVGNDKRLFTYRLNELDLYQLKILLSNIQFKLSTSNCSKLFESGFYLLSHQLEATSGYLGYDIHGLTDALRHNQEVGECLKELSCLYDISKYVRPESRLLMAVSITAYSIYNNNSMKVKFDAFLDKPVDEKIQNTYKNL